MKSYRGSKVVRAALTGGLLLFAGNRAPAATTTTPLSYSTTFTDPSGTPQSVSFTGTASGTSLTGTLTANGATP
jgi:hypothetical protein